MIQMLRKAFYDTYSKRVRHLATDWTSERETRELLAELGSPSRNRLCGKAVSLLVSRKALQDATGEAQRGQPSRGSR